MAAPGSRAQQHIHPVVAPVSAGVILVFVVFGAVFSDGAEAVLIGVRDWITTNLGWLFIAAVAGFLIFCFWLVVGRYAKVKLGPDDASPDFSYLTWFAMLFSAGMGIGLVFWGVAEPIFHYVDAPRVEGETTAAAQDAMVLTYHHWGLGAWAVYAVLGLSLAYFGYRHDLPMTIRSALYPLIGRRVDGWAGNVVDILAIFGTMFGIATSLGLGVMQINAGLDTAFGVPVDDGIQVGLIAVITLAATISVVTGLDKGIRRLSEINITVAALLMVFVAVTGPTLVVVTAYVDNLGAYLTEFPSVLFWSGGYSGDDRSWLSEWTIFYWAWWISWAPFVGTFIARISRGRTIREFVLGVLLVPSIVSFLWFTVMGNTAISFQQGGTSDVYGAMEAADGEPAVAMFELLGALPWTTVLAVVTIFVIAVFFVTSSDSGSYVIDMIASGGSLDPPLSMRVFWALTEGVVAAVLLGAGGLDALQAGAIATGLPFTIVLLIAVLGLVKGLRSELPGADLDGVVAAPLFEGESDPRDRPAARDDSRPGPSADRPDGAADPIGESER